MTGYRWKARDWIEYVGMTITIFAAFLAAYASTSHGKGIAQACEWFWAGWFGITLLLAIRR